MVVSRDISSATQTVPNVDFTSLNYLAGMPPSANIWYDSEDEGYSEYFYNGPSIEVQKIAAAVAAWGDILPIQPPAANSSWTLDFYGPSLSCESMEDTFRNDVEKNIAKWLWNGTTKGSRNCFTPYGYLAWTANSPDEQQANAEWNTSPMPFIDSSSDNSTIFSSGSHLGPFSPINLAVMPQMFDIIQMSSHYTLKSCWTDGETSPSQPLGSMNTTVFLQCKLRNASYTAAFNYESGSQEVALQVRDEEELGTLGKVLGPPPLYDNQSPNNIVGNCYRLIESIYDLPKDTSPCTFEPDLLRSLSYTAIIDAFRQIVTGSAALNSGLYLDTDTDIVKSVLINTPELEFLWNSMNGNVLSSNLQNTFQQTNASRGEALSNAQNHNSGEALSATMEDLFHNMTISLMSSQLLQ